MSTPIIDAVFLKLNAPRAIPADNMPIGCIVQYNQATDSILWAPTTTTIPVTGSQASLVEPSIPG